jgi:hypothetical protein
MPEKRNPSRSVRGQHVKNAVLFQKGVSGNPGGRAKMFTLITQALREKLASVDYETKKTYASRIADIAIECILHPDPEIDKTRLMAISEVIDRCEGKPKQQIDVNDVTQEIRARSDADLMYHMENGHWPEETVQ